MADPWAEFADAPPARPPSQSRDPWAEFNDAPASAPPRKQPGAMLGGSVPATAPRLPATVRPTGAAHDGDTFGLTSGVNARLSGVDAFELAQTGRRRDGSVMPLGVDARTFLQSQITPNSAAIDTGTRSYNRPVMMLQNGGKDVGPSILGKGLGLAVPEYLELDPRLTTYMEAERRARLNRQGAFAGQFQSPTDFRRGKPDPWAAAEQSPDGKGAAVFWDEPTPFQGLRPEIAQGYIAIAQNPKSTAAELLAYAKANGFTIDPGDAEKFVTQRARSGGRVSDEVRYAQLPQALTDAGDGALGAAGRGLADPINMLDEMGGVVDSLGGTDGRENIWSSDRRFGDVLWNNIDQNRAILGHDDAFHPYARFGGQVASGLAIPAGSVEGVGLAAARAALRGGASRMAAKAAAKAAVTRRLAITGAAEGGAAGFGAGEGDPIERAPTALLGAGLGAAGGAVLGEAAPYVISGAQKLKGAVTSRLSRRGVDHVVGATEDAAARTADDWAEFADAPPVDRAPDGPAVAAMDNDILPATISAPARVPDKIDIWSEFADAPSGALDDPALGRIRPMGDKASAEDMAATARTVQPGDMRPIPSNEIASLDEAMRANPGRVRDVIAPNERDALPSYRLKPGAPARKDPTDLIGWLRTKGGIRDHRGELASLGIDNTARPIDFAKSEGFLGKLIDQRQGMNLDDAAQAAWEAGYFPDHAERPTVAEFLDALGETHRGGPGRVFHPDDYATLDAFHAARAQRGAVETAAQEGSPLAEEVGKPIGLDDLDANQPPVTAYEDLPTVGGKAGNIRLDGLDSQEDIRRALISTEQRVGGFDAARRGKISQGETKALASELGMTADDLLKRRNGQALNAEQALAARSILAKSGDELVALARKTAGGSDEDLAAFRRAWLRHVAIQEQVSGATAEAGRALASFKMVASSRLPRGRVLKEMIDAGGGREKLEEAANAILELQQQGATLGAVNSFAMKAMQPKFSDKLVELWYNSLLSGPQTHVVNMLSNSITAGLQIPEHATAAVLGAFRNGTDRVLLSEVGERAVGLLQGTREGLRAFARTLRTGEVPDHITKVESRSQEAISGLKGKIIRTPTRLLSAEDELFKAIGRRMEISGLAMRQAKGEGLKGDALRARVSDLTANPTDEMIEKSLDYARYVTFQKPLGPIGQSISRMTQEWPGLKLILPFVRTPSNIFKYVIERSPAAFVVKEWRADFKAGGARRDLALAKMALGSGMGLLVAQLAADGKITGSAPADDKARELLMADGWQPYSLRIGDKYYSYQRLDPLASTLGVAADLAAKSEYMTDEEREGVASDVVMSVLKNLSNKTWLSGLADAIQALEDPDRYSWRWIARLAGSMAVPAGAAQIARTIDPVLRETKGPMETIRSRVPGLSQSLLPRRDIWGEEIRSEGGLGPDIMSPVWTKTRRNDPLNAKMLRIGAGIDKPSKKVGGVMLSPEDYNAYQAAAGRATRAGLMDLITNPGWRPLTQDEQLEEVKRIKDRARKMVREGMFGG